MTAFKIIACALTLSLAACAVDTEDADGQDPLGEADQDLAPSCTTRYFSDVCFNSYGGFGSVSGGTCEGDVWRSSCSSSSTTCGLWLDICR